MRGFIRTTLLAAIIAFSLIAGMARSAAASPIGQSLPQPKQPTSERFDINGQITSSGTAIAIKGSGAISDKDAEFDITVSLPSELTGGLTSASSSDQTVSYKLVDGAFYYKVSGLGNANGDQWYKIDEQSLQGQLSTIMPGGALTGNMMPGIGSMSGMDTIDPALLSAYTVTEDVKETINGAPTTRYKIDIDIQKVLAALKLDTLGAQYDPGSTLTLYEWIGDNDMYLYQLRETMNATLSITSTATASATPIPPVSVMFDLTYSFHDFDTAITITAPENAIPFDLGDLTGGTLPTPSAPPANPPATTPGMPRTGSADTSLPTAMLAFGLLLAGAGLFVRRRSVLDRL